MTNSIGKKMKRTILKFNKLLHNKVCFVTGSGSGLGKAICLEYAKQGAKVISADLNKEGALQTVKEMQGGLALQVDVTNEKNVNEAVDEAVKKFGKLDVMVCNAGLQHIE